MASESPPPASTAPSSNSAPSPHGLSDSASSKSDGVSGYGSGFDTSNSRLLDGIVSGNVLAGRYTLQDVLGTGAFGRVFRAWDSIRHQAVAIKILRDNSSESLLQFKQEFRALAEIRHNNLIRFYKLGRTETNIWFLAMELLNGNPLTATVVGQDVSTDQRQLAMETTQHNAVPLAPTGDLDIVDETTTRVYQHQIAPLFDHHVINARLAQLASGLRRLHSAGVIHCDLKPSNVLVTASGRVVILDFGVARYTKHLGAHHRAPRLNAGTRHYMSPEFRAGHEPRPSTDWYATGMMLAELLTGLAPSQIAGTPHEERVALFEHSAAQFPEHAALFRLAAGLLHPDASQRLAYHDVVALCGEPALTPIEEDDSPIAQPLFRRDLELDQLHDRWERYRRGERINLIIEGVTGIGKTALCREFIRRLSTSPDAPVVLVARCRTDELLGYRAFDELVDGIASVMRGMSSEELQPLRAAIGPSLAALFPTLQPTSDVAGRVSGTVSSPGPHHTGELNGRTDSEVHHERSAHREPSSPIGLHETPAFNPNLALLELQQLLIRLTEVRDVVIWVEDIHLADNDSRRWFSSIFSPGQSPRAFLLLTRRPTDEPGVNDHIDIDTLGYAIELFRMMPLDDTIAEQTIRRWLSPDVPDRERVIQHLKRFGRGHPYLLRELCRDATIATSINASTTLTKLLRTRLQRLGTHENLVLIALAAATAPLNRDELVLTTTLHREELEYALEVLENEMLIWQVSERNTRDEYYEISQRSIADTALFSAEPNVLAAIHQRHANLGIQGVRPTMSPSTIVNHLVRAGNHQDARSYAEAAAHHALTTGAWTMGAQMHDILLQIAIDSGEQPSTELRQNAIECRIRVGRGVDAARLLIELANESTAPAAARALRRRAAEALILAGHVTEGLRLNQTAQPPGIRTTPRFLPSLIETVFLDRQIDRQIRTLDERLRDESQQTSPYRPDTSTPNPADEAKNAEIGTLRMLGIDLGLIDAVQAYHFTIRELHTALQSGSNEQILRPLAAYCAFTNMSGEQKNPRVLKYLHIARRLAHHQRNDVLFHWLAICEGAIEYHNGNYRLGWEMIRKGYEWFHEHAPDERMMLGYIDLHRIFCYLMFCDTENLRKAYYALIIDARATRNRLVETTVTLVGFFTWLVDDVPEAAEAALQRVHWQTHTRGFQLYDYLLLRAQSELAIYKRDIGPDLDYLIDRYTRFEASLLARSIAMCRHEGRYIHGRLLLARAGRDQALTTRDHQVLRLIIRSLRNVAPPLSRGWSYILAANLAAFLGDREGAKRELLRALTIYESAGLAYYEGMCRIAAVKSGLAQWDDCPIKMMQAHGIVAPEKLAHVVSPILA